MLVRVRVRVRVRVSVSGSGSGVAHMDFAIYSAVAHVAHARLPCCVLSWISLPI